MAYTAYETATSEALASVAALCRARTDPTDNTFKTTTKPTLAQVERFLTETYYEIGGILAKHGYSPTQTVAAVLGLLQNFNVYGACLKVEMVGPARGLANEDGTSRLALFSRWKRDLIDLVEAATLDVLGGNRASGESQADGLTAGGISISDKSTIEGDADFEPYTFTRDMFQNPKGISPDPATNNPL